MLIRCTLGTWMQGQKGMARAQWRRMSQDPMSAQCHRQDCLMSYSFCASRVMLLSGIAESGFRITQNGIRRFSTKASGGHTET